ncbi:hypothetical protein RRG08_026812 [Elysia crispata]|uniref:Uncharacterized protein n=1 Tax=Elysia crispata TaxID=231223 RepID=A0AAE1E394_9GAST|nr:hypothetical protein RRG08_026812 [Elysia crispata]
MSSLPVVAMVVLLQYCVGQSAAKLLPHMSYDDIEDYKDHPCIRPCEGDDGAMVCDYNFLVERYHTLSRACWNCPTNITDCSRAHCVAGDGRSRGILTANRMMPGPAILVCEGDTIRVRVHNKMENAEGVTIHWHGLHQRHSPYMDGVAMVTQCPIPPHTAFTYVFKANPAGTHFWHAHSGLQRSDGLYGHLVVRRSPQKEHHLEMFDFDLPEHTLVVHDWWENNVATSFAKHYHGEGSNKPDSVLINGKGIVFNTQTGGNTLCVACKSLVPLLYTGKGIVFNTQTGGNTLCVACKGTVFNTQTGGNSTSPREVFRVKHGSRYRFRVASNGILNCPLQISVDDHEIEIIATDGYDVEPVRVQFFNIFAGERFDFILTANQSIGNYLLRVQGELDCGPRFNNAHQTAILHYESAPFDPNYWVSPLSLHGQGLNPINRRSSKELMSVKELRSATGELDNDPSLKETPDRKIVLAMDFRIVNNPRFHDEDLYSVEDFPMAGGNNRQTPQINDISFVFPPSPALTQLSDNPQDAFCNKESLRGRNCSEDMCECIHHYKVGLGDVVELVLVDQGHIHDFANHPTHLHGHGFRVLAMDKLGKSLPAEVVTSLDERGGISRNFHRPPKKDTVTIPDGGYTIVRFHADNPGMWLLHCHVEYHVEIGMAVLLQVGDVTQFPARPYRFPTCGDWHPTEADGEREESFQGAIVENLGDSSPGLTAGRVSQAICFVLGLAIVKVVLDSNC